MAFQNMIFTGLHGTAGFVAGRAPGAVLAQTLASRAYRALNRVCVGQARRVRFKSRGRGLSSIENKRNDTGLRFVRETPEEGHRGYLILHDDQLPALIDWKNPVVSHGLAHPVKYARLSAACLSRRAKGADREGDRYVVQLVLAGVPYHKPKHTVGRDTVGLDVGPASIAIVPREGEARLESLCAELVRCASHPRLQRRMERQRRAANPEHYDERGRPRKRCKGAQGGSRVELPGEQATPRGPRAQAGGPPQESAWPAGSPDRGRGSYHHHREGLLQRLAETLWQERGTSRPRDVDSTPQRHVASTGGTLHEVPTRSTKLSHIVTDAERSSRSRSRSVGTSASAALGRCP